MTMKEPAATPTPAPPSEPAVQEPVAMARKARRKAIEIEVVQFFAHQQPPAKELVGLLHFGTHSGLPNTIPTVFNKPHNAEMVVNDGDYVRIDKPDDIYPITKAAFDELYDLEETEAEKKAKAAKSGTPAHVGH